jgi:Phycobilisome protein
MLKQLNNLSVESDGRYASDSELKFLKDYLKTLELRVSAYEKIRNAEDQIVSQWAAKVLASNPNLYFKGNQDFTAICKRDRHSVLRISSAAMLMDDLENLRNGFLHWYRTIVHAFDYTQSASITYPQLAEILKQYLTPEEMGVIRPALDLSRSIIVG